MILIPAFFKNKLTLSLIEKLNSLSDIHANITTNGGNFHLTSPYYYFTSEGFPNYYINNPSRLIKTAVGSGGVEVMS